MTLNMNDMNTGWWYSGRAQYVDSIHLCQLDRRCLPFQCMWWGHVPKISKPFSGKCALPQSTTVARVVAGTWCNGLLKADVLRFWLAKSCYMLHSSFTCSSQNFSSLRTHGFLREFSVWCRKPQIDTHCNCCCCCCCCLLPVTRCWLRKIFWHQSSITVDLAAKHEKGFCRTLSRQSTWAALMPLLRFQDT